MGHLQARLTGEDGLSHPGGPDEGREREEGSPEPGLMEVGGWVPRSELVPRIHMQKGAPKATGPPDGVGALRRDPRGLPAPCAAGDILRTLPPRGPPRAPAPTTVSIFVVCEPPCLWALLRMSEWTKLGGGEADGSRWWAAGGGSGLGWAPRARLQTKPGGLGEPPTNTGGRQNRQKITYGHLR